MILPTETQLENCLSFGWVYLNDGIFSRGESIGYFTKDRGFQKE